MKVNKSSWLLLCVILLAACNKDNDSFLYKELLFPISISGYNATQEELTVKVDTFKLPASLGKQGSFAQSASYIFRGDKHKVMLNISEKNTGKLVLEKEIKKDDSTFSLNFLYMDGRVSDMPEKPAVVDEKISFIYMFIPSVTNYSEPVDFVIGKYYITPKAFEELARIKNVKPNEFSEPATISTFSTARQEYNGVLTSVVSQVRIYKAGTNTPYVDGTAYTWNDLSSVAPKPTSVSVAASKLYIFSEAPAGNIMRFTTRLDY